MATAPTVKTVPWNPLKDQATQQCVYGYHHATYDVYNMLLMGVSEDHDGDAASLWATNSKPQKVCCQRG